MLFEWPILKTGVDDAAIALILDRRVLLAGAGDEARRTVAAIIDAVRTEGDAALIRYTKTFDGAALAAVDLRLPKDEIAAGAAVIPSDLRAALIQAAENIRRFHAAQRRSELWLEDGRGGRLGMRFVPLTRVGVYVPGGAGGSTPLLSTVLMNIIPARTAGVDSIAVCSPPRADGSLAPGLLAALDLLGIDEVYRVGGAQAVAAMAYGTASIAPVDKIIGPGNRYVAEAKRQVFGHVGIDMLAGPSEVAVVADAEADPRYIAADLLAQAEHDPEAGAVLLTPHLDLAQAVAREMETASAGLSRVEIARQSLRHRGAAVITRDLDEALALAERMAPEHLEILTANPAREGSRVRNAGAVFLGPYSPEALGDYVSGTNHVLPTNGTARFTSGLGVDDFMRRMSITEYSAASFAEDGPHAVRLAAEEGLTAHAQSVTVRLRDLGD